MTASKGVQRVKVRVREGRGERRRGREADEGTETEREFNSTVDYAASLPDYCRYAFPFYVDEGITLRVYIHAGARAEYRATCASVRCIYIYIQQIMFLSVLIKCN